MATIRFLTSDGMYNAGEIAGEGPSLTREQMEQAVATGSAEWYRKPGGARQAPAQGVPQKGRMMTKGAEQPEDQSSSKPEQSSTKKEEEEPDPLPENTGAQSQSSGRAAPSSSRPRGRRSSANNSSSSGKQDTDSSS